MTEVDACHEHRAKRQTWCWKWVEEVLTGRVFNRRIQAFRTLEECMELVQTQGLSLEDVIRQAHWTYSRPVGEVKEEVGGLLLSLYTLCENLGISADGCEADEINRVKSLSPDKVRAKEAAKQAAGLF